MIEFYDTDNEILAAVVTGDIHAAAAFATTRNSWVEANPDTPYLPRERAFSLSAAGMAVRKGDLDTLNFLNGWITVNEANGWLEQRRQYWFEGREWANQVATNPDTIAECEGSFQ